MAAEKRPAPVSLVVGLLSAAGIFSILRAFTGADAEHGMFYPAAQVLTTILGFAALSGIWSMERWGLYLFAVVVAVHWALGLWTGGIPYTGIALLAPLTYFLLLRSRFS